MEGEEAEAIQQEYMDLAERLMQGTDGTVVQSLKDRDIFDLLGFE
jgi:light-independent protochlorophyllide reductase subunit L